MSYEILNQGAEAIIEKQGEKIIKKRAVKSYRLKELDEKIRKLRTRSEAKILEKASKIIPVPKIMKVDENDKEIVMENIEGQRLSDYLNKFPLEKQKETCEKIGENIARLHEASIIHGDLTPANMILVESSNNKKIPDKFTRHEHRDESTNKRGDINSPDFQVFFIDFGLGFISSKAEDKAVDLHLLREAFEAGFSKNWEVLFNTVKQGYSKNNKDAKLVLERYKKVEKRGRYKQGS